MSQETTMTFERINPQQAQKYLDTNVERNRRVKQSVVQAFVNELQNSKWIVTGETIKFDLNNQLIDGQHRLLACVTSNVTMPIWVFRNAPMTAFDVIDTGSKRTPGDALSFHGIKNYSGVAAAAGLVLDFENGKMTGPVRRDRQSLIAEVILYDDEYQAAWQYARPAMPLNPSATPAFVILAKRRHPAQLVDEFMEGVISGVNLEPGDPRLALRSWSINGRTRTNPNVFHLSAYIRAWNSFVASEQIKIIKPWFRGTPYPTFAKQRVK